MPASPPSERTRVRRRAERGAYERAVIDAVLDEAPICHVGIVDGGQPFVLPTIHVRVGDQLYLHGSVGSRLLRVATQGGPLCVTVTLVDGLVLARSAFHHAMNYRSVVVLGAGREVVDDAERLVAFEALVEKVEPGRWSAARPPNDAELRQTRVVAVAIEEASAKVRTGPPNDDAADLTWPVWAGVIPLSVVRGTPEPA